MELTKEHFDEVVKGLATKADLERQINDLEGRLIARIDESQAQLAQMVKRGFDDITAQLEVRSNVAELQRQMQEVREELNMA